MSPSPARVTVVIPNLNQGRFLERTLCSVLDQEDHAAQIIVADAQRSDLSEAAIACYGSEIGAVVRGDYRTMGQAINAALEQANGDYVTVIASGDLLLPGALHDAARATQEADWVVGSQQCVDAQDHRVGERIACSPRSLGAFLMHDSGLLPVAGSWMRTALLRRVGGFDPTLRLAWEYEAACRLLCAGARAKASSTAWACVREPSRNTSAWRTLSLGLEMIEVSRRYAPALPLPMRWALWRNCEARERIHALAGAEMHRGGSRQFLLQRLLSHPWWLVSGSVRHALLHGAPGSLPRAA